MRRTEGKIGGEERGRGEGELWGGGIVGRRKWRVGGVGSVGRGCKDVPLSVGNEYST